MKYVDLIEDLGGVWTRPFVTSGDPGTVDIAIVGINPATPILATTFTRDEFVDLLSNREMFEQAYQADRLSRGKRTGISPTRKRLRLLVECFPGHSVTETNCNSYPTKNPHDLGRSGFKELGAQLAEIYLKMIRPTCVIAHGRDTLIELQKGGILALGPTPFKTQSFVDWTIDAKWRGSNVALFSIPHLAGRQPGWTDSEVIAAGKLAAAQIS